MSNEQSLSLDDLHRAALALDPEGTYKQVTYNLTGDNSLSTDKPWWVFIPFGSWGNAQNLPKPSPLEDAVLRAIGGSSTNECFIDITNLQQGDVSFFNDPDAPRQVVKALADFVNSMPPTVTPVIRYLLGESSNQPRKWDGFVHALYDDNKLFTNERACLYCGNFAPSLPYVADVRAAAEAPAGDAAGGILEWLEREIERLWAWLVGEVRKYGRELYEELLKVESEIVSWVKRFVRISNFAVSWNHAKIFAVNGENLVTGGANYWDAYKTGHDFVFDLSMSIKGGAAADAHVFANYFWQYLSCIPPTDRLSWSWTNLLTNPIEKFAPSEVPIPLYAGPAAHAGSIRALSVGKNGNWPGHYLGVPAQIFDAIRDFILNIIAVVVERSSPSVDWTALAVNLLADDNADFRRLLEDARISPAAWASRHVRNVALAGARQSVRLSIQTFVDDIAMSSGEYKALVADVNRRLGTNWDGYIWPYDTLSALGHALANISGNTAGPAEGRGVMAVVSTTSHARGGYQDAASAEAFEAKLAGIMRAMQALGYINPAGRVEDVIKRFVSYKRIDNSTSPRHANHSKLTVIDDAVCYIGSDNVYPSYNQEFGLWIDDRASIQAFLSDYWEGLWKLVTSQAGAH